MTEPMREAIREAARMPFGCSQSRSTHLSADHAGRVVIHGHRAVRFHTEPQRQPADELAMTWHFGGHHGCDSLADQLRVATVDQHLSLEAIGRNQRQSEAPEFGGNRRRFEWHSEMQSDAIRGNQRQSQAIRVALRDAIRCNQMQSEAIAGDSSGTQRQC